MDAVAFANPLLRQGVTSGEDDEGGDKDATMPGALEATEGMSPEIATHKEEALASGDELSPEEQAVKQPGTDRPLAEGGDPDRKELVDEDTDTAALAEGRLEPPTSSRDEPI